MELLEIVSVFKEISQLPPLKLYTVSEIRGNTGIEKMFELCLQAKQTQTLTMGNVIHTPKKKNRSFINLYQLSKFYNITVNPVLVWKYLDHLSKQNKITVFYCPNIRQIIYSYYLINPNSAWYDPVWETSWVSLDPEERFLNPAKSIHFRNVSYGGIELENFPSIKYTDIAANIISIERLYYETAVHTSPS
jgi:hypothetical protein